jgi:hypothetical protein
LVAKARKAGWDRRKRVRFLKDPSDKDTHWFHAGAPGSLRQWLRKEKARAKDFSARAKTICADR